MEKTFKIEHKTKLRESGDFAFRFSVGVTGFVKAASNGSTIAVSRDKLEGALKHKFETDVIGKLGGELTKKTLDDLSAAIRKRSKKDFAAALLRTAKLSLKNDWKRLSDYAEWQAGLEWSRVPAVLEIRLQRKEPFNLGQPTDVGFSGKLKIHFGLSNKGWARVGRRVGPAAIRQFLRAAGPALRSLAVWLVETGALSGAVFALGGVLGTAALVAATGAILKNASDRGTKLGLITWYSSAYCGATVFDYSLPVTYSNVGVWSDPAVRRLRNQLTQAGSQDAVTDSGNLAKKSGAVLNGGNQKKEALALFADMLVEKYGSPDAAGQAIRMELNKKMETRMGLRSRWFG